MSIKTLIHDIRRVLTDGVTVSREDTDRFGHSLATLIADRLGERNRKAELRVSNLGTPCDRKLWYSINTPEKGEKLSAAARLKFLYGDILECVVLFLARVSGHTVTHEQSEVSINGVPGHIDALVDGELVDAKSASKPGFEKFKNHGLSFDDGFGYLTQIGAYGSALGEGQDHFLAIAKEQGHIHLDSWPKSKRDFGKLVDEKRKMLSGPLPERSFSDEPFQESGNRKLRTVPCGYCPFKAECWPGLKVAFYSGKPVFLTKIVRPPAKHIEVKPVGIDSSDSE